MHLINLLSTKSLSAHSSFPGKSNDQYVMKSCLKDLKNSVKEVTNSLLQNVVMKSCLKDLKNSVKEVTNSLLQNVTNLYHDTLNMRA